MSYLCHFIYFHFFCTVFYVYRAPLGRGGSRLNPPVFIIMIRRSGNETATKNLQSFHHFKFEFLGLDQDMATTWP